MKVDPNLSDEERYAQALGTSIKDAREAAGVSTQSELARRMGVRSQHVNRWENGAVTATVKTLDEVARALNRPVTATLPGGSTFTVTPGAA